MNRDTNTSFLLFLVVILLSPLCLNRAEAQMCSWSSSPEWRDAFIFAPKIAYQRLESKGTDEGFDELLGFDGRKELKGTLYGIESAYYYKTCSGFIFGGWASYAGGNLDGCRAKNQRVYNFDGEVIVGFYSDSLTFDSWYAIPYTGFGYTFNKQDYKKKVFHGKHLRKRYHILYVPVGIRAGWKVTPCFEIAVNFKAMPQVDSTVKINPLTHTRIDLDKAVSYKVELPFTWNVPQCCNYFWRVEFTPFWQQIVYGKSSKQECEDVFFRTPKQTYSFWGAKLEAGTLF